MLKDSFGRNFPYLRLSVTEVCNFRCTYCLPNGYQQTDRDFLTLPEIRRLATAFADLGTHKIRLTGGEPTVRRDLFDIAHAVSSLATIRTVALTTNGYNLKENVQGYMAAGINALNVSIDSLDPKRFHAITGHDKLAHVLDGIEAVQEIIARIAFNHSMPFPYWICGVNFINPITNDITFSHDIEFWRHIKGLGIFQCPDTFLSPSGDLNYPTKWEEYTILYRGLWELLKKSSFKFDMRIKDNRFPKMPYLSCNYWEESRS